MESSNSFAGEQGYTKKPPHAFDYHLLDQSMPDTSPNPIYFSCHQVQKAVVTFYRLVLSWASSSNLLRLQTCRFAPWVPLGWHHILLLWGCQRRSCLASWLFNASLTNSTFLPVLFAQWLLTVLISRSQHPTFCLAPSHHTSTASSLHPKTAPILQTDAFAWPHTPRIVPLTYMQKIFAESHLI